LDQWSGDGALDPQHDVTENIVIFHVFTEILNTIFLFFWKLASLIVVVFCFVFFVYGLIYGIKLTGASAHSKVKRASVS